MQDHLYSGKVVEAEITAIINLSTGRKVQIVYGRMTASINPAEILSSSNGEANQCRLREIKHNRSPQARDIRKQ